MRKSINAKKSRVVPSPQGPKASNPLSSSNAATAPLQIQQRLNAVLASSPAPPAQKGNLAAPNALAFSAQSRMPLSRLVNSFAAALHAVYVVALTEKAQHGLFSSSSSLVDTSGHSGKYLACSTASTRWLNGVSRLLGQTLSLDDLARLEHMFPHWLRMTWRMHRRLGNSSPEELEESVHEAGERRECFGQLSARVYFLADHVVSVEEAEDFLSKHLEEWKRESQKVNTNTNSNKLLQHPALSVTAYQSLIQQEKKGEAESSRPASEKQDTLFSSTATDEEEEENGCHAKEEMSDSERQRLLGMISPELSASLPESKLHDVLRQIKKEVNNEDVKEYRRIEAQRVVEQLVHIFTLIRAFFGLKQTALNVSQVLQRLQKEGSRTQELPSLLHALRQLLRIPASGLSLVRLDPASGEAVVVTESSLDGKESWDGMALCLDRSAASIKGVAAAVGEIELHDEDSSSRAS